MKNITNTVHNENNVTENSTIIHQENVLNNNSININNHKTITEIENLNILTKSSNNSSNEISKKEILNTIECENSKFEEQKKMRDTAWQQFGAEYNENGEFIGTPRNTDYTF